MSGAGLVGVRERGVGKIRFDGCGEGLTWGPRYGRSGLGTVKPKSGIGHKSFVGIDI